MSDDDIDQEQDEIKVYGKEKKKDKIKNTIISKIIFYFFKNYQ